MQEDIISTVVQVQLGLKLKMRGSFARNVSQNLSCNGVLITARETLRHIVGQLDPTTVKRVDIRGRKTQQLRDAQLILHAPLTIRGIRKEALLYASSPRNRLITLLI